MGRLSFLDIAVLFPPLLTPDATHAESGSESGMTDEEVATALRLDEYDGEDEFSWCLLA